MDALQLEVIQQPRQIVDQYGRRIALCRDVATTVATQIESGQAAQLAERPDDAQVPESQISGQTVNQHQVAARRRGVLQPTGKLQVV
jgi:hypothetical protein